MFAKFNKNLSDFARGGAQGTWWLVGSSILMSSISAFTFTGNASAAYESGPSLLVIYLANILGFAMGAFFLGPWLRQTRAVTTVDVVRARYGTSVEQLSAYTGLILGPISAAIQLYALSLFASTTLELPLVPVMIVIGIIVTFYSTTGGKWAVMATDFIQATVVFTITLLVCYLSLKAIGGFGEFFSYFKDPRFASDYQFINAPGDFDNGRFTLKWAIIVFLMQLNGQISLTIAGRYISTRDGKEASRAGWLGFVLMCIGSAVWFIPPMIARFLYEGELVASGVEKAAESSYAFIAMKLLPNGMVGMLIAAMFAATMSSMDTGLNNQVGVLARNIIPRLRSLFGRREPLDSKVELRICQIATVCLGIIIACYAYLIANQEKVALFDSYLIIASIIGIPMGFPMLVGLWVKKLPKWSYFPVFGACLVPSVWSFIDGKLNGSQWTIQERAMWIFIFGAIATVICRMLAFKTPLKQQEEIKAFYTTMKTPVDFDKEIGRSPVDYEQYFVLAKAAFVTGTLVLLILLVPNEWSGRLYISGVAASILSIGLLLVWGGKRVKARHQMPTANEDLSTLPSSTTVSGDCPTSQIPEKVRL
nr:hypothetical protein [Coraliomargarita parva]